MHEGAVKLRQASIYAILLAPNERPGLEAGRVRFPRSGGIGTATEAGR